MATTAQVGNVETRKRPMTAEEKKVIIASSAGTIFEWYDFYLYGALDGIIGAQFFTAFEEGTRNIFALLAFAAEPERQQSCCKNATQGLKAPESIDGRGRIYYSFLM